MLSITILKTPLNSSNKDFKFLIKMKKLFIILGLSVSINFNAQTDLFAFNKNSSFL